MLLTEVIESVSDITDISVVIDWYIAINRIKIVQFMSLNKTYILIVVGFFTICIGTLTFVHNNIVYR
jgi:hypothetical protein